MVSITLKDQEINWENSKMVVSKGLVFVGMIAMSLSIISMVIFACAKRDGESGGGLGRHGGGGLGRGGCIGRH